MLGNALRADIDQQKQCARDDSEEGFVGFFHPNNVVDKLSFQHKVQERMVELIKDLA